jgi:hypothetical protein
MAGVSLSVATSGGLSVATLGGFKRGGELALLSELYWPGEVMGGAG